MPPIGAGLYGSSGNMTLGFSGMAPQMSGFPEQAGQSSASAAQFEHIMPSSSGPSMFRSQASSSSFYLGGAAHPTAQDFPEDGQSQVGQGSLLHGKPAAFHSLMQLPEQHQPSSNGNLLNLGFFSGNSGGTTGGQDARLVFRDQFNSNTGNGSGGNSTADQGSIVTSGSLISNHLGGAGAGFPSLYNSSESARPPQMSATALLQKAAQMGATTSSHNVGGGASSLFRGPGIRAGEGLANERQFQNLIMNSLASGSGGAAAFGGSFSGATGFGRVDDGKLSTRDFLGVGGVVQGMSGSGAMGPPRHGAAGLHIGSLDPAEMK